MKSCLGIRKPALLGLVAVAISLPATNRVAGATNVMLWDTTSPFADTVDLEHRSAWKAVPADLFTLETNALKAASDPGYYGRGYAFKGDAVVENHSLVAVFWSAKGRVSLYPKGPAPRTDGAAVELVPLQTATAATRISRCDVVRNAGDEVVLEASFSTGGTAEISALVSFGKTEVVEVKPAEGLKGIRLRSQIEYGVVPSFIGDDLIFSATAYPAAKTLHVPSENFFMGLLQGEASMLVMTWPNGKQQMRLQLSDADSGKRRFDSVDFENDGQNLYLSVLAAPGLWHRQELTPSYLEKDVAIDWRPPFPARWKTQLYENDIKTTFTFREAKGQVWRGVPGSYNYPVWFDGDRAFYRLSKKVPPKGESVIYFDEGQDTPPTFSTPVDILEATLGRQLSDAILDPVGRRLRTHHRRGGDGVRRACTCGCTEAIQAVFESGAEVERKDYVDGAVDDMLYFVRRHVGRINEYMRLATDMVALLQSHESAQPELKPFLLALEQTVARIPQEYNVQKGNMKSLEYADQLARQTVLLTSKKDPTNLKAYLDLGEAWRAMGGAQDYVLAYCHSMTRKLFQEAGYGCVDRPEAALLAQEIRTRCRRCLRNADGYEIWPNY